MRASDFQSYEKTGWADNDGGHTDDIETAMPTDDTVRGVLHGSSSRKIRRLLRGSPRRQLVVIVLFIITVTYLFTSRKSITRPSSWTVPLLFDCPLTDRHIAPPPTPDKKGLSELWKTLRSLFDKGTPQGPELPFVDWRGTEDPPVEEMRTKVKISTSDTQAMRLLHEHVASGIPKYPNRLYSGRGIIMLAGGRYTEFGSTNLGMIRQTGSTLPVEVWMKDRSEARKGWCNEIRKDGMECRFLADYINMSDLKHPYQWKPFTMLLSSFEELLFLDADDMPMKNPDRVFDSAGYTEHGATLWPDYWHNTNSVWLPYIVGIEDEYSENLWTDRSVESGQMVWDKRRHWKSLCLATYYNYHGPKWYYTLLTQGWSGWGDKDTFPLALRASGESFHKVPHGVHTTFLDGTTQGVGMVQADPNDDENNMPLFLHANINKWSILDIMCKGCPHSLVTKGHKGALENPKSPLYPYLKEHKKIFSSDELTAAGLDPEPLMWKGMERFACRSVYANNQVCADTRQHMTKAFGFSFRAGRIATIAGYGDRVCVVNPTR